MVGTRRRSAVTKEDVEAAMEAMDHASRRSKLVVADDLTRTRSPRTSSSSTTSVKRASVSSRTSTLEVADSRPSTPTRSKKISESRPETPTRSKRLGESRPSTPSRSKRLSESVCLTPTRKSRRLSGSGPEELQVDQNNSVLPLKKRRTSMSREENRLEPEEEVFENADVPVINVIPPQSNTETNLEAIKETEEIDSDDEQASKQTEIPESETKKSELNVTDAKSATDVSMDYLTAESDKSADYLTAADSEEDQTGNKVTNSDDKENVKSTDSVNVTTESQPKESFTSVEKKEKVETAAKEKVVSRENDEYDILKKEKVVSKENDEYAILKKLQLSLLNHIPRQKPKSGRFWKSERAQFRSLRKDKGNRRPFEHRMKLKEERDRNREIANELQQQKNQKKEDIRKRMEENKKKKEENQLKSEIYQVVKNPNKIKRMKKRDLAKRDLLGKV